jgi:mannosyltransferase
MPKPMGLKPQRGIVPILLLATVLYGYQLGAESLWLDEAYSIESAQGPLDLNRPLYFLLLRLWLQWGTSEVWLRGLSALFGLVSVYLIYLLGRKLSSEATGLLAALLWTLSPLAINHAQEVRFYTMSTGLGLSGSLALAYALEHPTVMSLAGWIALRLLGILTAQVNLLLLVPDLLLLGLSGRKKFGDLGSVKRWGWLGGLLAIPLLVILIDVVPPLLEFARQAPTLNGISLTPPGPINFVGALATFTAWPLKAPQPALAGLYQLFFNLYALIIVGVLVWTALSRQRLKKLHAAITWGMSLLILIFGVAQISVSMWGDRYLLVAAPYILIVLAEGFRGLWMRQRAVAMLIAVLYAIAVSSSLLRYYTVEYRHDWRGLAHTIQMNKQMGDKVLLYPSFFLPTFEYYYQNNRSIYPIDRDSEVLDTQKALQQLQTRERHLWLVYPVFKDWNTDSQKMLTTLEKAGFRIQKKQTIRSQWGENINLSLAQSDSAVNPSLERNDEDPWHLSLLP